MISETCRLCNKQFPREKKHYSVCPENKVWSENNVFQRGLYIIATNVHIYHFLTTL